MLKLLAGINKGERMKEIKMPIYFWEEETGVKHYDFEEMADELENRILKTLNKDVEITITQL